MIRVDAKMPKKTKYDLIQDKKGAVWDLLLYIPTIIVLIIIATQLWYNGNQGFTYVVVFLTSIIFFIAFNRIAKTRLMILPTAPVAFSVSKKGVSLDLKNGDSIELVKDLQFFSDMAGKSIGLVGVDLSGVKKQFVFHKGQFNDPSDFDGSKAQLKIFK